MIPDTDWIHGLPPNEVEIDVFALGYVRRGWRERHMFILSDCTHPMQNSFLNIEAVTAWRTRDSFDRNPNNMFCPYF